MSIRERLNYFLMYFVIDPDKVETNRTGLLNIPTLRLGSINNLIFRNKSGGKKVKSFVFTCFLVLLIKVMISYNNY